MTLCRFPLLRNGGRLAVILLLGISAARGAVLWVRRAAQDLPAPLAQAPSRRYPARSIIMRRGMEDELHYGLRFEIPADTSPDRLRKRGLYEIAGRHGPMDQWALCLDQGDLAYGSADLPSVSGPGRRQVSLLIPRSWLIRMGFLSPTALVWPSRPAPVWDRAELLESFWLEEPADDPPKVGRPAR